LPEILARTYKSRRFSGFADPLGSDAEACPSKFDGPVVVDTADPQFRPYRKDFYINGHALSNCGEERGKP